MKPQNFIPFYMLLALANVSHAYDVSDELRSISHLKMTKKGFDIAHSTPIERCFHFLKESTDAFKSGDVPRSQAALKQIAAYARPLGGEDRAKLSSAITRMSRQCARGNGNLAVRVLLLTEARNLIIASSPSGLKAIFDSDIELAQIYDRAKDKGNAVTLYTRALSEGQRISPLPVDDILNAYRDLAKLYIDNADTKYATACISNGITFTERVYGKSHLSTIPLLVMRYKCESKGAQEKTVVQIKGIVDGFVNVAILGRDDKRRNDINRATSALKALAKERKNNHVLSQSEKDNKVTFAWLAYKLRVKASEHFDSSSLRDLAEVLHDQGKLAQEVQLYKDTITQLERSADPRNQQSAAQLRYRYSKLLVEVGDVKGAELVDMRVQRDKDKHENEKRQDALSKLAELETRKGVDLGQVIFARMDVLKLRLQDQDVPGTLSELSKMQNELMRVSSESNHMHSANFKFNSIIKKNMSFISKNTQISNKILELVALLEQKSSGPTGIERTGLKLNSRKNPENADLINQINARVDAGFKARMVQESKTPRPEKQYQETPYRDDQVARDKLTKLKSTLATGDILKSRAQYLDLFNEVKPQALVSTFNRNEFVRSTDRLMALKQMDAAETGMRRVFESYSLLKERDLEEFLKDDEKLTENLVEAYIRDQNFIAAVKFLQYKIAYVSTQQAPDAALLAKNQFLLSQIYLQAAHDKTKAATCLAESKKLYEAAIAGMSTYYGINSSECLKAAELRERELKRLER